MSRDEGFAVMDVSTSLLQDTKVRKLQRHAPDRWPVAMVAYVSAMAESWKAGHRVSIEDAWPVGMVYDPLALDALIHVDLVDGAGLIVTKTWRSWFGKAKSRRSKSRADWRKWQQSHRKNQGRVSPDSDPDTSIPYRPSVRSSRPSGPSVPPARAREGSDGPKDEYDERSPAERLSDDFKAGRINELEYQRLRKGLSA